MDSQALERELIRLGPWHIEVDVVPGLTTRAGFDVSPGMNSDSFDGLTFKSPKKRFLGLLERAYPNGLEGRSVLDCACNCGAFSFFAKEAGAGECLSFDAREHWIEQARFLAEHRTAPTDRMRFEVCELDALPALGAGPFDLTIFNGIFYHLPDPVRGLKIAADQTSELLILNTAAKIGYPEGALVAAREPPEHVLSGVHGLNWFPSGPAVLASILEWLGFPATRCTVWRATRVGLGQLEILAARDPGTFDAFDSTRVGAKGVREVVTTSTPPGATVLVVSRGRERLLDLPGREAVDFELDSGNDPIKRLTEQHAAGADYLLVPDAALAPEDARVLGAIEGRFLLYSRADGLCRIFALWGEPEA